MQRRRQLPNDYTVSELIAETDVNRERYSQSKHFFFGTRHTTDWMILGWKPDAGKRNFTLQSRPDQLWGTPSLL
jgi:hypothetical protein